jgi:hypothetical protein
MIEERPLSSGLIGRITFGFFRRARQMIRLFVTFNDFADTLFRRFRHASRFKVADGMHYFSP